MPWTPRSLRRASDSPTTAYFEAQYTPAVPRAARPPTEETLTMWPPSPRAIIRGTTVWTPLITPPTLTPITQSQSA